MGRSRRANETLSSIGHNGIKSALPLRETSFEPPPVTWASVRKPSHFSSKSRSGWSKGSRRRCSGMGV